MGIKFQVEPDEEYNEIILHIRFRENDARLQQETLGILGVNLIYGAFTNTMILKNYYAIYMIIWIKTNSK